MSGHAYTATAVHRQGVSERRARSGPLGPLALAGACVLALALVWVIAELVPATHFKDAVVLHDFTLLSRPRLDGVLAFILHLLDPLEFVIWGIALAAFALGRARPRIALAIMAVMALAPLTTETLKPLAAHSHVRIGTVQIGAASWPSGHSTAALALALCVVLVMPSHLRGLAAGVGALFALAVGCSLLILAWHMPSDVLAGYLVASLWMALAVAALRAAEQRWPTHARSET